ncbi:MAG: hypothetical protein ACT4P7_10875 [Gemmatimonadaceae bacterium]
MTLRRSTYFPAEELPDESGSRRRAYRPPAGIPARDDHRREATLASLALHLFLIILAVAPPLWLSHSIDATQQQGPSGDGRMGGGGGGSGGDWKRESLRYFAIPEASKPAAAVPDPIPPPKPEEVKPPEPPTPVPKEEPPKPVEVDTTRASNGAAAAADSGRPAGTGKDGTAGNGPGTGGGVGSGVGPGRGSGTGPGTGAGNDDSMVFPPTVVALPILPLPVPNKVRPYKLVAYFEVDTLGNAKLLAFNPSNDGGYNRRIREMLGEIRFRPAVRGNGRPVLDTAIVTAEAPRS